MLVRMALQQFASKPNGLSQVPLPSHAASSARLVVIGKQIAKRLLGLAHMLDQLQ